MSKNNKIFDYTTYQVIIGYENYTDIRYEGDSKTESESEFNLIDNNDNECEIERPMVILSGKTDKYKFIGDLDKELEETIEDYPIEDYYNNTDYYELIEEGDWEEIKSKELIGSEETANNLEDEVQEFLENTYGRRYGSYNRIILGEDSEGDNIDIQVRVKDHSENPKNKSKSLEDHYLSIVIANNNATKERFHSSTELYFTGDNTIDEIKEEIYNYIQNIIYDDNKIVKLSPKLKKTDHFLYNNNLKGVKAMKITVSNLVEKYPQIKVKLPEALNKTEFDFVKSNIDLYNDDGDIKKYIDTFVSKLNEVAGKETPIKKDKEPLVFWEGAITKNRPEKMRVYFEGGLYLVQSYSEKQSKWITQKEYKQRYKAVLDAKHWYKKESVSAGAKKVLKTPTKVTPRVSSKSKNKPTSKKKVSAAKKQPSKTERLTDEIRFIKRYVLLNGKVKSKHQILTFINALQKAIIEKRISKTSKYAKQILRIQDSLVELYNSMSSFIEISINPKSLQRYKEMAYGKAVYTSVAYIKRYIGIHGKEDVKIKAKRLLELINKALQNGKIPSSDPYIKEIKTIKSSIEQYVNKNAELNLTEPQLRGLQGIAGIKASKKKVKQPEVLNGIANFNDGKPVSASEFAKLHFNTMPLRGKWSRLIGSPGQPFKLMIYGKAGGGKSTLAIDFANSLAVLNNRVLYIAGEESFSYTLQEKIKRIGATSPNLFFDNKIPSNVESFQFVFIDSVTSMNLSPEDMRELYRKYPNISWIGVFHVTKDGNFRGETDYEHDVDAVIKCENGQAYPGKNRFGGKESIKIY